VPGTGTRAGDWGEMFVTKLSGSRSKEAKPGGGVGPLQIRICRLSTDRPRDHPIRTRKNNLGIRPISILIGTLDRGNGRPGGLSLGALSNVRDATCDRTSAPDGRNLNYGMPQPKYLPTEGLAISTVQDGPGLGSIFFDAKGNYDAITAKGNYVFKPFPLEKIKVRVIYKNTRIIF